VREQDLRQRDSKRAIMIKRYISCRFVNPTPSLVGPLASDHLNSLAPAAPTLDLESFRFPRNAAIESSSLLCRSFKYFLKALDMFTVARICSCLIMRLPLASLSPSVSASATAIWKAAVISLRHVGRSRCSNSDRHTVPDLPSVPLQLIQLF
jgi:hypothetical protein